MKSFLLSVLIFLSAFAGLEACASKDVVRSDAPNANRQDNNVSTTTDENGIVQNQTAANKFAADNRKKDLPIVKPSGIVEELIKLQAQNRNVAAADIVKAGNELAKTHGYKYVFENCPLIKQNDDSENEAQTNNLKPFYYKMTKTDGKEIEFQFMIDNVGHPCFCIVDVPTLQVNQTMMTIIADGKPVALKRPKEFYLEEFVLVDASLQNEIRKWFAPIDSLPVGISADGKKIYFENVPADLDGLVYEISEDGTIRFAAKDDAKIIKGEELEGYPKTSEISYKKFKAKDKEFIVKFSYPCT